MQPPKTTTLVVLFALAAPGLGGCLMSISGGNGAGTPDPCNGSHFAGLTAEKKLRADRLISVFENDTAEIQYAYVEALDDGRGYTAGRAGFTTGTGDALEVVRRYVAQDSSTPLAVFLPRLEQLADTESGEINGLEGFPQAWQDAAQDADFRAVQDEVVDELYYRPAIQRACAAGLRTSLAIAEIYDAIIQHGEGDDPDGLPALIERTRNLAGGTPASGVDEAAWLYSFLDVRRQTLQSAFDPDTRDAWAESVYRVDIVRVIAESGNFELNGPIVIDHPDHQATIP